MALIDLPLDPPDEPDLEKRDKLLAAMAHERLSLPSDVDPDEEYEVVMTGPKTAIVYLTLAVSVELD